MSFFKRRRQHRGDSQFFLNIRSMKKFTVLALTCFVTLIQLTNANPMRDVPEQPVSDIPKRKDARPHVSDSVVPVLHQNPTSGLEDVEVPVPAQPEVVPEESSDPKYDVNIEDVMSVINSMGHNLEFEMSDDLEKQLCEMFSDFVE